MSKPHAFIDGDILLYRAASFCEGDFDGEPIADVGQAVSAYKLLLDKWLKEIGPVSDYTLVLTVGHNYRKDLDPTYKAQRKEIVPHPTLRPLKAEVMEWTEVVWEEGIEADDYIGIKVTEDRENRVAVSADKDFATLPCRLYIPNSHGKTHGWHSFTEDEANLNWLRQVITGDVTDNYKGLPRHGPKKAEAILPSPQPVERMWAAVAQAYAAANQPPDYLLTQARLARILRYGEYDWETKKPLLWMPPGTLDQSKGT